MKLPWVSRRVRLSLVLGPLAALLLFALPDLAAPPSVSASPDSASPAADSRVAGIEADFLLGMIPHHRGAIMMAELALAKSQKDEVRELAQQMIDNQQREIILMTAYLRDWYGMAPPEGATMPADIMARMDMPMLRGMMPDMPAHMMQLERTAGDEFNIAFMSAIIDHHSMAIMMATPVLIASDHSELRSLAADIVIQQGEETKQLQEWLAAWYGIEQPL